MSENKFVYVPNEDSDYLEHGKLGEAMKNHLYTARKWVNGKWQYTYGKINNALGADEKQRRDAYKNAYQTAKYQERNAQTKARNDANSYRNAPEQQRDQAKYYKNKSANEYTKAVAKSQKIGNAAKKASDEYDRTVYGRIDKAKDFLGKGKNAISDKINKGKATINGIITRFKKRRSSRKMQSAPGKNSNETYSRN